MKVKLLVKWVLTPGKTRSFWAGDKTVGLSLTSWKQVGGNGHASFQCTLAIHPPPGQNGHLLGAGAPPMAKVMRKEARHTQKRDRASGVPLEILEHLPPKPESAYFLLCALTYTSDFMGGCPPLPVSEKKS